MTRRPMPLSPEAAEFAPSPHTRILAMLQLDDRLLQDEALRLQFEQQFRTPLDKKPQEFDRLRSTLDKNVGPRWYFIAYARSKGASVPEGRAGKCERCDVKGPTNWFCSYVTMLSLSGDEEVNAAGKRWQLHLR
jgi:hypothetical protein